MVDLYSVHDYRDYLSEVFAERKQANPLYSYRLWARQLGLDAAQLFRILAKSMHLPLRSIDLVVRNLKLAHNEAETFRILVNLGRARNEKDRKILVEDLLAHRDVQRKTLTREQYLFFKEWYHSTLRCLVGTTQGRLDVASLAKHVIPPLEAAEVKASLQLQESLGLLQRKKGRLEIGEPHLSTDEHEIHQAIRDYQAKMLRLGAEALERFHKDDRDFSTLTFAVDKTAADEIHEILTECRRQIQRRIDESGSPDRVLHLSMSLFPTAYVGNKPPWKEITQ